MCERRGKVEGRVGHNAFLFSCMPYTQQKNTTTSAKEACMPSGNKSTPFSLCPLLFSLPYPSLKPRHDKPSAHYIWLTRGGLADQVLDLPGHPCNDLRGQVLVRRHYGKSVLVASGVCGASRLICHESTTSNQGVGWLERIRPGGTRPCSGQGRGSCGSGGWVGGVE